MTQYIHLLTTSGITQSSDLWVPATKNVKPQFSKQASLGFVYSINKTYLLEVESYYKTMDNVIEYKDGASFLLEESWENKVSSGKGEAYGVEFLLKKTKGKFTGLLGYTLSWSNRTFEEINFGKEFPFRYDRRHDISLSGRYVINDKWAFNGLWTFYTGNAVTVPTSSYITPDYGSEIPGNVNIPNPNVIYTNIGSSGILASAPNRNNNRLPAYHRLDLTATFHKNKDWGAWEITFGLTNLYNKQNASFYYSRDEQNVDTGELTTKYYQTTMFPLMPTFSYRVNL